MTEAQKILTKHLSEKGRRGTPVQLLIPNILEAMEEYAAQFTMQPLTGKPLEVLNQTHERLMKEGKTGFE